MEGIRIRRINKKKISHRNMEDFIYTGPMYALAIAFTMVALKSKTSFKELPGNKKTLKCLSVLASVNRAIRNYHCFSYDN